VPSQREAAICAVREHLHRWKVTHLIAISENHLSLINNCRADWEKEYTFLFPRQDVFERPIRVGLVARSLAGDTEWLLVTLRKESSAALRAVPSYLKSFRASTKYFMCAWDSPKPLIANFVSRFIRTRRPAR
jgi:hypothetical protein